MQKIRLSCQSALSLPSLARLIAFMSVGLWMLGIAYFWPAPQRNQRIGI